MSDFQSLAKPSGQKDSNRNEALSKKQRMP
jgi:hypothetical protein